MINVCNYYFYFRSIGEKSEYVNSMGLGGAMVWSIETEDFKGACGEPNPLLKTINDVLRNGIPLPPSPPKTSFPQPTTAKPNWTPTENSNTGVQVPAVGQALCVTDGSFVADPSDRSVFYRCVFNPATNSFIQYPQRCPNGLVFDPAINTCNWP